MKNFFYLLTLVVFLISAPLAMAEKAAPAGTTPGASAKPSINCCNKGQCKQVGSEMDCTKDGGKVVKECKDCK